MSGQRCKTNRRYPPQHGLTLFGAKGPTVIAHLSGRIPPLQANRARTRSQMLFLLEMRCRIRVRRLVVNDRCTDGVVIEVPDLGKRRGDQERQDNQRNRSAVEEPHHSSSLGQERNASQPAG